MSNMCFSLVFNRVLKTHAILILITFHYQKVDSPESELIQGPFTSVHSVSTGHRKSEIICLAKDGSNCNLACTLFLCQCFSKTTSSSAPTMI